MSADRECWMELKQLLGWYMLPVRDAPASPGLSSSSRLIQARTDLSSLIQLIWASLAPLDSSSLVQLAWTRQAQKGALGGPRSVFRVLKIFTVFLVAFFLVATYDRLHYDPGLVVVQGMV